MEPKTSMTPSWCSYVTRDITTRVKESFDARRTALGTTQTRGQSVKVSDKWTVILQNSENSCNRTHLISLSWKGKGIGRQQSQREQWRWRSPSARIFVIQQNVWFFLIYSHFSHFLWGPWHSTERQQDWNAYCVRSNCHLLLQHGLHVGGLSSQRVYVQRALEWNPGPVPR